MTLTPEKAGQDFADKVAGEHQQPTRTKEEYARWPAEHSKHRIHPDISVECKP